MTPATQEHVDAWMQAAESDASLDSGLEPGDRRDRAGAIVVSGGSVERGDVVTCADGAATVYGHGRGAGNVALLYLDADGGLSYVELDGSTLTRGGEL